MTTQIQNAFYASLTPEMKKIDQARNSDQFLFAHYTSAETAVSIIRNEEMWMRNAEVMNDFSELQYGFLLLESAIKKSKILNQFSDFNGMRMKDWALKRCQDLFSMKSGVYLAAVAGQDISEWPLGKLSMWRAYASNNGVCFLFNKKAFLSPTDILGVKALPVVYSDEEKFNNEFNDRMTGWQVAINYLDQPNCEEIFDLTMRQLLVGTKHPSFKEEEEWRVVYSNHDYEQRVATGKTKIASSVKVINGVPQIVKTVPLSDFPEEGFVGASLNELINHILVGPSAFPERIREAIILELDAKGVADASSRVRVADIPLRTS